MSSPPVAFGSDRRPVLFVAREPDETLRTTFLPVMDRLRAAHNLDSRVLFYHRPGEPICRELERRGVLSRRVDLPTHGLPQWAGDGVRRWRYVRTLDEIGRLRRGRSLARRILATDRPAAVVVIQDTLFLERFLVREANGNGLPTVGVQWAFSFPQSLYDRLREVGRTATKPGPKAAPTSRFRRLVSPLTGAAYRAALRAADVRFSLVNSYGGGEARLFAVIGQAFEDQFRAQGVTNKRIVVTGHPAHDAAYARASSMTDDARTRLRAEYGLPTDGTIVLYATQPVLWRRVITPAELEANVRAIASAVHGLPGRPRLVIKLHPRERADDYAFCAELEPTVQVIERADLADLIAASDAFISSSSSTVLLAMMLGRPIVTVNFNQVPHFDVFESIGGTLHARSPEAFALAIRRALGDRPTRERLAEDRGSVLARYSRFDGRSTERLAALIARAVTER